MRDEWRRAWVMLAGAFAAVFIAAGTLWAQVSPDWTEPFPPFRIAGNLYYVGSKDLASYLITTPRGHILINSDLETSVPLIRASVEKLGFKFNDIRILLISHAHWDHDGGSAEIKRLTGATYMVMDGDVSVVESGGKTDFQYGNRPASLYPPTKVDRVLHDDDEVKLGGVTLVAHLTPGHTKGCTTWTMKVEDAGKLQDVVIIGSPNVNDGYKLVGNSSYPEIASDYERTFQVLKSLPVDFFLGAHGDYFGLETKYARLKEGGVSPFIDPAGYKRYITDREAAYRTELAKQKAALRTPSERAPPLVTSPTTRQAPPTRDPNSPGFVTAKELPDGSVPPLDADGNFVIGPTHTPAFEMVVHEGVPRGAVHTFTMSSADSKIFPGIARDSGTFGTVSPTDPATLVVTTSHPANYTRTVAVYVPAQYVPGTIAPFIVGADGPDQSLFAALDNLIAEKRVPVMIAISIGNGSGDAQGSERGLEYDTMSGRYAEFVETEVLPLVERQYNVTLTKDPEGRATMGGSSGGSAAFIMAWYHPELYHRVLAYSITAVNQQWPHSEETPHGAWEFHERIIPNSPVKPIRVWLEVGDRDLLNPNVMRDGMHDWVVASENMARALAAKGYHYQFVFARNAGHVDRGVKQQTLPEALEWLWKGYPIEAF
jgi:enterochelin esterase family protein